MKLKLISTVRKFQEGGKTEKQDKGEMLGRKKLYKDNSQLSEERLKEAADEGIYSLKDLINKKLQSGIGGKEKRMLKRSLKHLDKNEDLFRLDKDGKIVATNEDGSYSKTHTGVGEGLRKIFGGKQDKDIATGRELKDLNFAKSLLGANTTKDYVGKRETPEKDGTGMDVEDALIESKRKKDQADIDAQAQAVAQYNYSTNTGTQNSGGGNSGGTGRKESEESKLAGKQRSDMFNSWRNYPELQDMYRKLWNEGGGAKANQDELHKAVLGKLYNNQMIDGNGNYLSSTKDMQNYVSANSRNNNYLKSNEGKTNAEKIVKTAFGTSVYIPTTGNYTQRTTLPQTDIRREFLASPTGITPAKMNGGKMYEDGGELEKKYMNSVKERMAIIDNELNGIMKKLDEGRNIKKSVSGTRSYSNVANNTDLAQKDLRRRAEQLIYEKKQLGNMSLSQKNGLSNSLLSQDQLKYSNGGVNTQQNNMKQSLKFGGNLKSSDNNLKKKF